MTCLGRMSARKPLLLQSWSFDYLLSMALWSLTAEKVTHPSLTFTNESFQLAA